MRNSDRRLAAPARHRTARRSIGTAALALLALSPLAGTPADAQPGWGSPWGGRGWGRSAWDSPWGGPVAAPRSRHSAKDPREGRVQVSRFVRDDAAADALAHGSIKVVTQVPDAPGPEGSTTDWVAPDRRARFEAAVVNSLVSAGYDTMNTAGPDAQVATLSIRQRVLVPAEEKRSPVSGAAAMSVGTYGQSYGLAVNVDLSKARTALVSTRLDLKILDHAEGKVLWEGNAEVATYEGDEDWSDDQIATKLAEALLDRFPEGQPVTVPVTEIGIPQHPPVLPDADGTADDSQDGA